MTLGTVILVLAMLVGLYMAWNIGANDVANAMGTSVGSGALTLKQAILVAAIFEFAGALLVGGTVTNTIRKGIVDVDMITAAASADDGDVAPVSTRVEAAPISTATPTASPQQATPPSPDSAEDAPKEIGRPALVLALGMTCCLLAAALWLNVATYFGWPVSTTHSIVGAVVGFGAVAGGLSAVNWFKVGQIAASWVVSPVFGGFIGFCCFKFLTWRVLSRERPLQAIRRWGPVLIFPIFAALTLAMVFKGLKPLGFHKMDLSKAALIALGVGSAASLISFPLFRRFTRDEGNLDSVNSMKQTERVFLVLQIMTACFVAFAHGSNDVANAVGPLAAVVGALSGGVSDTVTVPVWVLLIGAMGIVLGLATYGYKVMGTVGEKITELTPSRGFTAEFAAAVTIVMASKLGLPVSTTHTLVGSVIGVALARGIAALNTQVLKGIVASWFLTVPVAAILSVALYTVGKAILL